jgi:hypothetical protein
MSQQEDLTFAELDDIEAEIATMMVRAPSMHPPRAPCLLPASPRDARLMARQQQPTQ